MDNNQPQDSANAPPKSDLVSLLTKRTEISGEDRAKILAYLTSARTAEKAAVAKAARNNKSKPSTPLTDNTDVQLINLAIKYYSMGVILDGVNAVVTGKNMVMVTYTGYKNKILDTYPETKFSISLVREGDQFSSYDEDGHVHYTHKRGDSFGQPGAIIGAYVVIKNKRGEYLETLNRADYEKMRDQSRQASLWNKWESEFVLKSVLKRACKRHFNDVVAAIDKDDNDQYGIDPDLAIAEAEETITDAIDQLQAAQSGDELRTVFMALPAKVRNNRQVFAEKERLKASFSDAAVNDKTEVEQQPVTEESVNDKES